MRRIILFALLLFLTVTPCKALTFFRTDYDGDTYVEETAYSGDWLPLLELSEIMPYSVEWKDRTVYIYGERTWTIKPDWWIPEGVKIVDGVTYVTLMQTTRAIHKRFGRTSTTGTDTELSLKPSP